MASLALGAAGAAIGGVLGTSYLGVSAVSIGWSIGSYLGGQLFSGSGENVQGPRLSDLSVQSSAYGRAIPVVYGTARIAGNVIWSKPLKERSEKEESGGKGGGGSVTTFTYSADFAVGLCEGEIAGIRRIWADAKLIYNAGESSSIEEVVASNQAANNIAVYTGSEDQEPSSLIQADLGVENTQAYRGLAYIVFSDLQLEDFGNRIPSITCEVVKSGGQSLVEIADHALPSGSDYNNSAMYINGVNGESVMFISHPAYTVNGVVTMYNIYPDGSYERVKTVALSGDYSAYPGPQGWSDVPAVLGAGRYDWSKFRLVTFSETPERTTVSDGEYDLDGLTDFTSNKNFEANNATFVIRNGFVYAFCYDTVNNQAIYKAAVGQEHSQIWLKSYDKYGAAVTAHNIFVDDDYIYVLKTDDTVELLDLNGVLQSTISLPTPSGLNYSHYGGQETIVRVDEGAIYFITGTAGKVYVYKDSTYTYLGEDPQIYNHQLYGGAYVPGTSVSDGVLFRYRSFNHDFKAWQLYAQDSDTVTLSSIQADICDRAGLDASDYDVTELTDEVNGYVISDRMTPRAATEPLQQAFLYDAVESGNKIKFVKRGGSSVASIPEIDLGASVSGKQPLITQTRQQDSELPSQVVVNYIDIDRDYQSGSQRAQRINANVDNVVTIDLQIVMDGDKAKQISEILLYNAWTDREKFNLSLTSEYIDLDPADVITVTANDETRLLRISSISYGSVLSLECLAEDAQVYTSNAVAGEGSSVTQTIGIKQSTNMKLLDIPLLRNVDEGTGIYLAAAGRSAAWTGASIFKSIDSGVTYSQLVDMPTATKIGQTESTLADAPTSKWDRTSTVDVRLAGAGTLSSATESAVLSGANYILIGDEILQFVNKTLNSDGSYTLDTFIRGQRGTEWATSGHTSQEQFVLLDENALRRVEAVLSTERNYKAVTYGTYLDNTGNQAFTNAGNSYKPFSVSHVKGSRDGSENLDITWIRRSRYVGAPLGTLPLFEDSESYEIDIMSGATVKRTLTSSSESKTYSAALQTTDFGSPQSSITIRIYQISATIGRGYVKEVTL